MSPDPAATDHARYVHAQRLTVEAVEAAICEREPQFYIDHHDWAQDCDGVSQAIVDSGLLPGARIARGTHRLLDSDHSWVALADGNVLDATLWSYTGAPTVHVTDGADYQEHPA